MKHKKLLDCPFCGSDDVGKYNTDSGIDGLCGQHYIMCNGCYNETGKVDTVAEAVALWNARSCNKKENQ